MAEDETSATVTTTEDMAEGQTRATISSNKATRTGEENVTTPAIIVQGGAFSAKIGIDTDEFMEGTKASAIAGYTVLTDLNGTAVDAVEKAVCLLENNKHFNAGYGSYLNSKNEVECEAMIMEGNRMNTGAVMALRQVANPVSLSRKIMDNIEHCALTGKGALEYARSINFPILEDPGALIDDITSIGKDFGYEGFIKYAGHHYGGKPVPVQPTMTAQPAQQGGGDTVTVVAMDRNGHLACATSTGGMPGKLEGRVGDAPLVGCGGYANEFGAATTTGHGEKVMKMTLAREVVYNMERGENAQVSAERAIKRMQDRVDGYGGVIAIDKDGNFGKAHNTEMMYWASMKDGELQHGTKWREIQTSE